MPRAETGGCYTKRSAAGSRQDGRSLRPDRDFDPALARHFRRRSVRMNCEIISGVIVRYALYVFLEAEVSLSGRADTGRTS